jgi:hypothetical protein
MSSSVYVDFGRTGFGAVVEVVAAMVSAKLAGIVSKLGIEGDVGSFSSWLLDCCSDDADATCSGFETGRSELGIF